MRQYIYRSARKIAVAFRKTSNQRVLKSKVGGFKFVEMANLITAIGSLIVAVLAFSTSVKVSGLEDFFRSEIQRRNQELNEKSDQLVRLEREGHDREFLKAQIQNENDMLLLEQVKAERDLRGLNTKLAFKEAQVAGADRTLSELRERNATVMESLRQSNSTLADVNTGDAIAVIGILITPRVLRNEERPFYLLPVIENAFRTYRPKDGVVATRLKYVEQNLQTMCELDFKKDYAMADPAGDLRENWKTTTRENAQTQFENTMKHLKEMEMVTDKLVSCLYDIDKANPNKATY